MYTQNTQNSQLNNKQSDEAIMNKSYQNGFYQEIKKGISKNIGLKKQKIFKKHQKQLFSSQKYGNYKIKPVLLAKKNSIINRNSYHIQKQFKSKSLFLKHRILGGGCGGSKFQIENLQKIETKKQKLQIIDEQFLKDHQTYTNKKAISDHIEAGRFGPMQLKIFQCILSYDADIRVDICLYKNKLVELIDVYLIYLLSGSSEKEILKQTEIDKLGSSIKEMKKSFDMESNDQPCLDMSFYFDILDQFNSNRVGKDTQNKSQFEKVAELISSIVKLGVNVGKAVQGDITSTIKLALQGTDLIYETYKKSKANQLFTFLLDIWRRKLIKFGDQIWELNLEQELDFYLNQLYEQCCQKEQENELILLTLIKIDYFFNIALEEEQNRDMVNKKFPLNNELIIKILPFLMQKVDSQHFLEFLSFTVQNPTFRFLAISILLKYYQIISDLNDFIDQKEKIFIYLSYKYLCEIKKPVKVAYITNKQFVHIFNKKIDDQLFKEKILEISRNRIKDIPIFERSEEKIENTADIDRMVALILIDQWERNVKKRQKENIAQKDDLLLEVKDLYIQQSLIFLQGSSKLKENLPKNVSSELIDENKKEIQQLNALKIITDIFLQDNGNIQDEQKKTDKEYSNCRILGILAEGGTGKSMLIKKLEQYLIENSNSKNSGSENKDFIPLLIKCNALDPINPSIEQYLKFQGIEQIQIESLKNSIRKKVILLDGYDEYTGEYFRIYEKLNIKSWKNTKIIVTSRREKLSLNEAHFNFSIDNEKGQIDESSFCILKLEEFKNKDITDYCERYFRQYRVNEEKQFDQALYQKDLTLIKDCMQNNKQLENLLYLPINLYLFTRMIVEIKDQSQIQEIKTSITDQISIQEIFFKEQFKRETQDFIHTSKDSDKINLDIQDEVINTYFEYFQVVAMKMFLNKGKEGVVNFLQIQKDKIEFSLRKDFEKKLSQRQQKILLDKIINYVNSKIITRIKEESSRDQRNNSSFVEFKHKSLFEYFVARAMKYDIYINGNNIYKLPIEKLKEFKINQKSIMDIGQNQSEQQILIKLYKLIKKEIECEEFRQNYYLNQIERNNKYIQYLKRSQIQRNTETSQIDIGASNLISALFLSKFSFSQLSLTLCSFSKAYICNPKSSEINFDRCNFQHSYLNNSHINFDSCNIQSACFDAYSKVFDSSSISSFNQIIWGKNNLLYCTSQSGFINSFKLINKDIQLQKSKQLSQTSLYNILFFNGELLLVSSEYTLFLVNSDNFDIKQVHKFTQSISNIILIEESILVALKNQNILKGTFDDGFQSININGNGLVYNKTKKYLISYQDQSFSLLNTNKNFEIIKKIQTDNFFIVSAAFSEEGKYFIIGSSDGICQIWDVEQDFSQINSISGHNSSIFSIAFSTDGKYLATFSENKVCKIWNAEKAFELIDTKYNSRESCTVAFSVDGMYLSTGSLQIWNTQKGFELINTVQKSHNDYIVSVNFSADGKYLATGSFDRTCKIWNVKKGFELVNTLQGHSKEINSVSFSADVNFLATGSSDNTCKVWNAVKGFELINTLQGHSSKIYSVMFSVDGKYLATGSFDTTCKIWNAQKSFELINTIQVVYEIYSVAFSANGMYLATGSYGQSCKIWNVEKDFDLIQTLQGHTKEIHSVAFSGNGKYLATGSWDNTYKIWNTEKSFELITTILGHSDSICSVGFSADGKYFITGSKDNTCKIWNVEKGFELLNIIEGHTNQIYSVAFSSDGKYIVTSSYDSTYKIWNVEKGFELINSIKGHSKQINSVAFSNDGKYHATVSWDNTCKVWNPEKGFELINTILGHSDYIYSVAFSADGKLLATSSFDKTCKIWKVDQQFQLINTIIGHSSIVYSVAFSADGKYLATSSYDNTCKIWNAEKGFEIVNTIESHTGGIYSVAFSYDGKYLATGSQDKSCKIWNVKQGFEPIITIKGHTSDILSVAFSADGKYLSTGSEDKTCKIWNAEKGFDLISTIQGHTSQINSVAFSTDGKFLATGSSDNTCKIWNIENGFEFIKTVLVDSSNILSVAFSTDGKYFSTGSKDKTCKIWNVEKNFELLYII